MSIPGGTSACLVFTKTAGYRHGCIPKGIAAVRKLEREHGFAEVSTEDPERIRPDFLENLTAVAFLNTSGNVLDAPGRQALQAFLEQGGGFAGIHAACDTGYDWPWSLTLVGAYFLSHPLQQKGVVRIEDREHASTQGMPDRGSRWDESTYRGGKMGPDHPIVRCHENAGGRSWYTGCGHTQRSFSDPLYLNHLHGGLRNAMQIDAL